MKITVRIDLSLDLEIDLDELMGGLSLRDTIYNILSSNHMDDIVDSIEVGE